MCGCQGEVGAATGIKRSGGREEKGTNSENKGEERVRRIV